MSDRNKFQQLLDEAGFAASDQVKDFGYEIPYVIYVKRVKNGLHEYVSVMFFDGVFTEAVFEVYLKAKNTRRPPGGKKRVELERDGFAATVGGAICRSFDQLKEKVS